MRKIRLAFRKLVRRPVFSVTTVLCLALGIGATAAIGSVINTLYFQSRNVRDLDRVVFFTALREGVEPFGVSPIEIEAYLARSRSFRSLGVARTIDGSAVNLTGGDRPERVRAVQASTAYLETLGVEPFAGRFFLSEEERSGGPGAVLIGHSLWNRRFGGDRGILGRALQVDGELRTIVGVLGPGFDLPQKAELWIPLVLDFERLTERQRGSHSYMLAGRLADDATMESAEAELVEIARALETEFPNTNTGWSVALVPLRYLLLGDVSGSIRLTVFALAGAVALLLVIACVNAAHLFLARFVEQEREIALSAALGASRKALLSPLFLESLLLALLGGALGTAVALAIVPVFMAASPIHEGAYTNSFRAVSVDARVLGLAFGVTLLTSIFFGIVPVLGSIGKDPSRSLREGGRTGAGPGHSRWSRALVVAEVGISATLLVASGLLVRSFQKLSRVDLGFSSESSLSVDFTLPEGEFDLEGRIDFATRLLERVRGLPDVVAAGATTDLPLRLSTWDTTYLIEGEPPPEPGEVPWAAFRAVTPGYLEALSVTPVKGRMFTDADRAGTEQVAVVSEALVERELGDGDPIGRRVGSGWEGDWWTIVGVVRDVKENRANFRIDRPVWYVPYAQLPNSGVLLTVLIRARSDPAVVSRAVRVAAAELFPNVAPGEFLEIDSHVRSVVAAESMAARVVLALAVLGTALAAIGLYGVMAYSVRQRLRELGLRSALGATPADLKRLVVGRGFKWTLTGLAAGFVASFVLSRLWSNLLFETSAVDPLTYGVVAFVFASVTATACYLPARRASATNPAEALHNE